MTPDIVAVSSLVNDFEKKFHSILMPSCAERSFFFGGSPNIAFVRQISSSTINLRRKNKKSPRAPAEKKD
jgi:hypothetical protein